MILHGERVALPAPALVHRRFEEHAHATPEAVAVRCADRTVTYADLDARANRFARNLLERGLGRGARVGLCLDYSTDLVVALLGTLKSGATYVPLDPSYPAARLRLLLGRVPGLALVVADRATAGLVASAPVEVVEVEQLTDPRGDLPATAPEVDVTGDDLCYAVFTSGSTGVPKVAGVRHEGWYNLLNWLTIEYGLHAGSHNLVVSALGFDLSQRSLMAPLFCGATLHLMPSRNIDVALAYRLLREHDIRTVHCASSTLYLLIDWETARGGDALARLDYVLFGGERLQVDRVAAWARSGDGRCTLLHQYGVAECTDVATSFDLAAYRPDEHDLAPVGRPAHNTEVHVLDERMRGVDQEEHGEIWLSGIGVGAGYLDDSGGESGRFATTTVGGESRRLYRTGDRGYVNRDGELVVVGRIDAQVKVRGMRIDPADVERALGRLTRVREAAVVTSRTEAGETELVAFLVPDDDDLAVDDVRDELAGALPRNMVPGRFVTVARIPLNPHGKIDRAALADTYRDRAGARGT